MKLLILITGGVYSLKFQATTDKKLKSQISLVNDKN